MYIKLYKAYSTFDYLCILVIVNQLIIRSHPDCPDFYRITLFICGPKSDAWTSFGPSSGCPQLPGLNDDLPRIKSVQSREIRSIFEQSWRIYHLVVSHGKWMNMVH